MARQSGFRVEVDPRPEVGLRCVATETMKQGQLVLLEEPTVATRSGEDAEWALTEALAR